MTSTPENPGTAPKEKWLMRLYIAGQTAKSARALTNLKKFCETHLDGQYEIEVIDLMEHPEMALADQIIAIPTLVRKLPAPLKKIIGDLSQQEKVLAGMDISLVSS